MKKVFLYTFLVLMSCNTAWSQSSLPECEGNDKNISSFSYKHFKKVRSWTNCYGTSVGQKGEKYVGEFYEGVFHGKGTFTHNGRKYVGEYKKHKRHGQGTYTYANGDKYVGEWKKNKYNAPDDSRERDGQGTYTYSDGRTYVGTWKKGLRHGKGIFTEASGKVEEGFWKNNKLVKKK